jgi:hypothetical protein
MILRTAARVFISPFKKVQALVVALLEGIENGLVHASGLVVGVSVEGDASSCWRTEQPQESIRSPMTDIPVHDQEHGTTHGQTAT